MRPEVQRLNVTADRVALETQRVQLVATTAPPGGEFELTVTFGDLSTAISEAVSADASAEDVRGALQALGVGPVKVTRARASGYGFNWDVQFLRDGVTDLAASDLSLTDSTISIVTEAGVTQDGTTALGGSFTLSLTLDSTAYETVSMPFDVSARDLEAALETALSAPGALSVRLAGAGSTGRSWVITFAGADGSQASHLVGDMPDLVPTT